jgi:hypothetical protein
MAAVKPIARCGCDQYAVLESIFAVQRPLSTRSAQPIGRSYP